MVALSNWRSALNRFLLSYKLLKFERQLSYDGLELSFQDDFDGRRLDTNKWMTHYYWGHTHSEYEHQFYSAEAFHLKNSILTINVENRKVKGWAVKDGKRVSKTFDVTSGLIHTGEYFKQRYGRFEIRCKVPMETGFMPSFWLINPSAYPPEIDVMDFGEDDNKDVSIGYVYGDDDNEKFHYCIKKTLKRLPLKEWNTYTVDWTPHSLVWYINGIEMHRISSKGIPQTPMYIAINMAIGADQKVARCEKKMQIDWVKVYKFSS